MAADNKLEFVLSLSLGAFQRSVKAVTSSIGQMGGKMQTALTQTDGGFKRVIASSQVYHKTLNNLNGTASHFRSTMMQLAGVLGGSALFGGAARMAISFNSTVEQSRIGIAALVRTFSGADMGSSFEQAEQIQKRLQIAGLQTTATYEELLRALQEGIGPALRENFNPQQVVAFTQSMTQAAAAISLPMDQLGQELRAILDGTIDRNARIAKALQIDNEDIKQWRDAGLLFEKLQERLKEFAAAGEQSAKTFSGAWSNVVDAVGMALGQASKGAFSETTQLFLRMKDAIVTVDEAAGTFKFNEKIMAAFVGIDQAISKAIGSLSTEELSEMFSNFIETLGAVAVAVVDFTRALVGIGQVLGPLGPVIAKVVTWMALLGGAFKLVIGLPIAIYGQIKALSAGFTALSGGSILLYIKHVQTASTYSGVLKTAIGSLGNAMTVMGAVFTAAFIGWEIGTILNKFEVVQRAGIAMAAGIHKSMLRAKQAWASVSGGDMAAVQRQIDEVDNSYAEMFANVGNEAKTSADKQLSEQKRVTEGAKNSADSQKNNQKKATDEMKKAYKGYADTVKRLQDDIAGREKSLAEQLRDMDRSGMDDYSAWKDRKAQAEEFAEAAREAEEAAEAAFKAGDETTGEAKYQEAVALYDQAKTAAAELNTEIRVGDEVIQTQGESLKIAKGLVSEYGVAGIAAQKNYTEAVKETAIALDKQTGGALSKELPEIAKQFGELTVKAENLAKQSAEFNKKWNGAWDEFLKDGTDDISKIEAKLRLLTKDRHIKVYVQEVQRRASGGAIGALRMAVGGSVAAVRNMLGGGFFPGYGGGDRRHVVAEDGEYMLDKNRVKDAGLDVVRAFHAGDYSFVIAELMKKMGGAVSRQVGGIINSIPIMPSIGPQFLQAGGAVSYQAATSGDTYNFHFPANTPAASRDNARRQVDMFMSEMQRRYKGASK